MSLGESGMESDIALATAGNSTDADLI